MNKFSRASLSLIISVALLFSFGLLMVFNTTSAEVIDRSLEMSTHAALLKQLLYAGIGLLFGVIAYRFGYESLLRYSGALLVLTTVLLVLVFVPKIGLSINGARRWLSIFGLSFQPSECAKILLPAAYIHWFFAQEKPVSLKPFLKMLAKMSVPILLILFEPDNGTTAILILLFMALFFLTKIRLLYWAVPVLLFGFVGAFAAYQMPHVPDRIRIYLHPELDLRGKGHQPHQAKIAAGSGKLWGRGLGESLQKLNYLPEARSDYIAAIFAEEMGFVGILALVGLYMLFASSGFLIAIRSLDKGGFFLGAILTFFISMQAFLNLGVVSGLLPSKGTTLPFFSQGGTALMVNFIAFFLLLDISRKSKLELKYGSISTPRRPNKRR